MRYVKNFTSIMIAKSIPFLPLIAVPLDLIITPLYRIHGQEPTSLPGLVAAAPPRRSARGREQDSLAVQLLLTGTATFTVSEYAELAALAAERFHQAPGPMTSALRAAAEVVNASLLERNMSTSGRGQYAIGWLALLAVRDAQCTLLISGPMHAFFLGEQSRHVFEPALSGRGLGVAQATTHYFTQADLKPGDRILLTGRVPSAWESTLRSVPDASLEALRRRLLSLTTEDLHAVLLQAAQGNGNVTLVKTTTSPRAEPRTPEATTAPSMPDGEPAPQVHRPEPHLAQVPEAAEALHAAQPAAYAIAPQPPAPEPEAIPAPPAIQPQNGPREFPPSIPRAKPKPQVTEAAESLQPSPELTQEAAEAPARPARRRRREKVAAAPRPPSELIRRAAKGAVSGMKAWRGAMQRLNDGTRAFLPRLLPGNEAGESQPISPFLMTLIALAIPLIIGTAALVMYARFGNSALYENNIAQAKIAQAQAASLTDPIMQRDAWLEVLAKVDTAEKYRQTPEAEELRRKAENKIDSLMGVVRLRFQPAFTNGLGIEISRMAATDNDLYLLDARTGEILRAELTGHGFQRDMSFDCKPGAYGGYQVGALVDILALPIVNSINATVMGVDAGGNLLYCAPGQVPQAIPLPLPDTNWGRVTAMALDAGNLYVLDAPSRAVWVYSGKDGAFVDQPYFFFQSQIPQLQDGIDLVVKDDSLFLLHADGHISTCSYSRLNTVTTRCVDPAPIVNPYPAYGDSFAQEHITQMLYSAPPDSTILLLGADSQGVLRLTPGSLELQNQIKPAAGKSNPLPAGPVDAMAAGPNHVLYLAIKDRVYFAENMP